MKGLKILHGESSLGWGGQERRILLEIEAMRRRGCEVHLVCDPQSIIARKAAEKKIAVHLIALHRWFHPMALFRIYRLLRQEKYDVVHTHSSADSWALGLVAKSLDSSRPRLIRTRHLSTPVSGAFVYTHLSDLIITTGTSIREHLIDKGVSPDKIFSIPTGVDLDLFRPSEATGEVFRREMNADDKTVLIGNVAVLRGWKGHDDFLGVAKEVHAQWPATRFVIAGDGPQRDRLGARVAQEGLSGFVRLLGHREDIPKVLSGLDIFLFTSYANEGVPQAIAQAMAMGKPVVSTRAGSITDLVVDGQTGLLAQAKDVGAIARQLITLLQNPDFAQRLGQSGRARVVSRFSLADMEDAIQKVYQRVLGENGDALLGQRRWKIALIRRKVSPRGGAESVVHRLAEAFVARGHDVHVLAAAWESPVDGVVYHRMGVHGPMGWLKALSFQRSVKKYLQGNSFDVVHGFDKTFPVCVYRAGDGSHRAWLAHAAGGLSMMGRAIAAFAPKNWVALWLEKKLLSDPSLRCVIANSDLVRRELLRYHRLAQDKVITVPNGIDLAQCHAPASREERAQAKQFLRIAPTDTVLLFVGNNYHRKGLIHALEALAQHKEKPITLLVAGSGREGQHRRFTKMHGIAEKVRFLGPVRDTKPLYRASDLLVLPTLYDPFSNVCLEAMAHGVPVLTTPTNGASEAIVAGKTGWIVHPRETKTALGEALKADLWAAGRAALEQSKAHDFSAMAEKILDAYGIAGCWFDSGSKTR